MAATAENVTNMINTFKKVFKEVAEFRWIDGDFSGKKLLADYECRTLSYTLGTADAKIEILEIPGSSDYLDLTESLSGDIEYKMRKFKLEVEYRGPNRSYFSKYSELMNDLHGQHLVITPSWDKTFYMEGRVEVTDANNINGFGHKFTITADIKPYKIELQPSTSPWEWDEFDFEYGIIRDYYDLVVPGTYTIIGRRLRVCPIITCSTAMSVTYLGNTYPLMPGDNQITAIFLGEGEHELTFTGSGTVNITYQGGSL